jgi:hypothetical protein
MRKSGNRMMQIQAYDGEKLRIPMRLFVVCCDCGLKHLHEYKVIHKGARHYLTLKATRMRKPSSRKAKRTHRSRGARP